MFTLHFYLLSRFSATFSIARRRKRTPKKKPKPNITQSVGNFRAETMFLLRTADIIT